MGGRRARAGDQAADTTLSGTASDLYLQLWNRPSEGPVQVDGDPRTLELWRTLATI